MLLLLPLLFEGILCHGPGTKVKPEAWVSKGPSPGPGRLLLVCHVSGFFPKSVWVRWMRGQQELPGTQQGEVLPNADTTWYLRVTLNVAAGEATGLTCRVKHSSLRGHDIIIHWDGYPIFLILICLAVLLTLVMLVVADSWIKKQSSNVNICSLHGLRLNVPTKVNIQEARNLGHQLCLAQKSWMKNSFLNKCKISLSKLR
uniref:CD1e molecule n=1 Tax=Molossus molossus TaxID=27622 RepID=A0A7J8CPS6_MOLMO|nr:CD1e molecule [Molossus molossus]